VKIGGYTDNSGDPAANLRLSQARADSVMNELRTMGVGGDRLEAEGYGDQHPIADNATADGRAKNRRVAVRVTAR
jgi:K(+)-stimulated pyrophosphate-energized sodium pump